MLITPWLKASIALAITFNITTGYANDREIAEPPTPSKKRRLSNQRSEEDKSFKRRKHSPSIGNNDRDLHIERMCKETLTEEEKQKLRLANLFPHRDFPKYTDNELIAFSFLWTQNDPIPHDCLDEIILRANSGNLQAQRLTAAIYKLGKWVPKNPTIALYWYEKAAEEGDAFAQMYVGKAYQRGDGVKQDSALAFKWIEKSALQGNISAQMHLAYMYEHGIGIPQDLPNAFKWTEKAALQGNVIAQIKMAEIYDQGKGVDQDTSVAFVWTKLAAKQGLAYAQNNLALFYEKGRNVNQNYITALKWYIKSADQNNSFAQSKIGDFYRFGYGVSQDYPTALEWHKKAADRGHVYSQGVLGDMFFDGQGTPQDHATAFYWHEKAAISGNARSQLTLGNMYYYGQGIPKDYIKATQWYMLSADQGNHGAQTNLGNAYKYGNGVPKDLMFAIFWHEKAANQGSINSQNSLRTLLKPKEHSIFASEVPQVVSDEHCDLLENLSRLQDHYCYSMGFSGGGSLKGQFGSNPELKTISNRIFELIGKYQTLLIDNLLSPYFLVDCLIPAPLFQELRFDLPLTSNSFVSLTSLELLNELQDGELFDAITQLSEMVNNIDNLLNTPGMTTEQTKGALNALKIFNPEAYSFLSSYTDRYVNLKDGLETDAEHKRIITFLKDFKENVKIHWAFARQLNSRVRALLVNTAPYRNTLCKQMFPYLFTPPQA